jgi:flagellin-specific chaperone FliS
MSDQREEGYRDILREEKEFMIRRLEDMQKKKDIATLQDMLEVKNHIQQLNKEISESYNHTSSQKK